MAGLPSWSEAQAAAAAAAGSPGQALSAVQPASNAPAAVGMGGGAAAVPGGALAGWPAAGPYVASTEAVLPAWTARPPLVTLPADGSAQAVVQSARPGESGGVVQLQLCGGRPSLPSPPQSGGGAGPATMQSGGLAEAAAEEAATRMAARRAEVASRLPRRAGHALAVDVSSSAGPPPSAVPPGAMPPHVPSAAAAPPSGRPAVPWAERGDEQRSLQAGAPSRQSNAHKSGITVRGLEGRLIEAVEAVTPEGTAVNHGSAMLSPTLEPLTAGQAVFHFREHLAQLQRELADLDALAVAAMVGQLGSPALRRSLATVIDNVGPMVQAPFGGVSLMGEGGRLCFGGLSHQNPRVTPAVGHAHCCCAVSLYVVSASMIPCQSQCMKHSSSPESEP